MTLIEIFTKERNIAEIIADLKVKTVIVRSWAHSSKEYDPTRHEIVTNKTLRPDKRRANGKIDKVARITYGLQKLSVKRMTQMAFSIPVKRVYVTGTDKTKIDQSKAIEAIYKEARINAVNSKRMHAYFAACEIATIWYVVPTETHNLYGFPTKWKLRCRSYSPMEEKFSRIEQSSIYPLKDRFGDLIALSFEYVITEDNKEVTYFETYTKTAKFVWKQIDGEWSEVSDPSLISIEKIPAGYMSRPIPIWEDSTTTTQEIEFTLSRGSDIIKKNAAPVLVIKGELQGTTTAPEGSLAREVYQIKGDGGVEYATWQQQIEAQKFHISTLKQNVEEELQLPNLSMENMKGLGAISGEARKTLLTEAHLKVGDESGDIIEMLEREFNVIKAFVGEMNTAWKDSIGELKAEHIITPFIQNDEQATIDKLSKATGGKAMLSRKEAVNILDWVDDKEAEIAQLDLEEQQSNSVDAFTTSK
jgi:hypothetical protein